MVHFPKLYADRVAKLRVPGGFALVIAFAIFSQPTLASLEAGLPVAAGGLIVRAWAAGHLAKNRNLARWDRTRIPVIRCTWERCW